MAVMPCQGKLGTFDLESCIDVGALYLFCRAPGRVISVAE